MSDYADIDTQEEDWERLERQENQRGKGWHKNARPLPGTVKDNFDLRARRQLYHTYRWGAKNRGHEFEIEQWEFDRLVKDNCFYCGSPPLGEEKLGSTTQKFLYNGVDRFDNTKGYTSDNVKTCCKTCNYMKLNHTFEDFLGHIRKIVEHLKEGNHEE